MNLPWLPVLLAYLVGALPFGWLVARWRGVDLFAAGSGNIGATNVGRVLGKRYGIAVFVLDFLKGALPVALLPVLMPSAREAFDGWAGSTRGLATAVAVAAFLGHLFPVYLGFRGGKGVATGLGTILVLVPGPGLLTLGTWIAWTLGTSTISAASLAGVVVLMTAQLLGRAEPFGEEALPPTLYCLAGGLLVVVKHRGNVARQWRGTESRLNPSARREEMARGLHRLCLGMVFGSGAFFTLVAGPRIFASFDRLVREAPNERSGNFPLLPEGSPEEKQRLGSALAGAAVGPVFPAYFALHALGACWALGTLRGRRAGHLILVASVAAGWLLAEQVTALRLLRLDADPAVAAKARAAFGPWHLASLLTSMATTGLAGWLLATAGRQPERP